MLPHISKPKIKRLKYSESHGNSLRFSYDNSRKVFSNQDKHSPDETDLQPARGFQVVKAVEIVHSTETSVRQITERRFQFHLKLAFIIKVLEAGLVNLQGF